MEGFKKLDMGDIVEFEIKEDTTKGKGLPFAEDNYKFHYWKPTSGECERAFAEMKRLEEV